MNHFKFCLAALIFVGNAALADSPRYTATLAQALPAKKEVIANSNIWRCDGMTCVLASTPRDAGSLSTCFALEREVGTLTAFGMEGKPLDGDKLAKCNSRR